MPFIQFQFRRGTSSQWNTTNPLLADGEIGIETDTNKFKLGNGTNNWSNLAYGGVQGVQGTGFVWRGIWSSAATYEVNHAVFYNGTSYVSLSTANVNKVPPSFTSDWGVIASQGVQGPQGTQGLQGLQGTQGVQGIGFVWRNAWSSGENYNVNHAVFYNGTSYVSTTTANTNKIPTSFTSDWTVVASQGVQGTQGLHGLFAGQGVQGVQGVQGPEGTNTRGVLYFNAANNQTIFNIVGGYTTNKVDVFKNGVKLQRVSDYTDTSGTDIVLINPATDNDLVEVVTYTSIPLMSDVYTQAQSDARYVNNQKLFAVNWIFGA